MVDVAENTTSVLTVTATDADLPPQSITYSIVGGADQSKFSITSGGMLTFNAPPDYEMPRGGDRSVDLVAVPQGVVPDLSTTDVVVNFDATLRGQQMILTLTSGSIYQDPAGSNTPPSDGQIAAFPGVQYDTFVAIGGATAETSQSVLVVGGAVDLQPGAAMKFDSAGLNVAWAPAVGVDVPSGTDYVTARITLSEDAEGTLQYFGSTSAGTGEPFVEQDIPIVNGMTSTIADNVYEVVVQASDGNGGTATQTIHVNVTPVNDNVPTFTSPDTVNVAENSTGVMTVAATDADLPAQTLTYSIVGGADQARFGITSSGELSFNAAPNFEAPADSNGDNIYVVDVQASDGNGGMTPQTISVTVTPVNEFPPVFTSPATASVPENTTTVLTVTATDADLPAQAVSYSIVGGVDQSKFSITGGGALSFIVAPDYQAPTDANSDNVYVVTVEASDGHGGTTPQTINVSVTSVTDFGDAPDAACGYRPGELQHAVYRQWPEPHDRHWPADGGQRRCG